jgi:PRTRC genetic system protein C
MAAVILSLTRVFRHEGIDLPDPDPSMEPGEVLAHYTQQYPRLAGGKVVEPVVEGDQMIYELRGGGFGDKG